MKFAHVTFSEDTEINARGETLEDKSGKKYQFPANYAEKLAQGFDAYANHEGPYDVPEDEVADRFGQEAEKDRDFQSESDSEGEETIEDYLEARTVDEVEEDLSDVDDEEYLEDVVEASTRKGVQDAAVGRLAELEEEDDEEEEE